MTAPSPAPAPARARTRWLRRETHSIVAAPGPVTRVVLEPGSAPWCRWRIDLCVGHRMWRAYARSRAAAERAAVQMRRIVTRGADAR